VHDCEVAILIIGLAMELAGDGVSDAAVGCDERGLPIKVCNFPYSILLADARRAGH
jgi:hypothetical protein